MRETGQAGVARDLVERIFEGVLGVCRKNTINRNAVIILTDFCLCLSVSRDGGGQIAVRHQIRVTRMQDYRFSFFIHPSLKVPNFFETSTGTSGLFSPSNRQTCIINNKMTHHYSNKLITDATRKPPSPAKPTYTATQFEKSKTARAAVHPGPRQSLTQPPDGLRRRPKKQTAWTHRLFFLTAERRTVRGGEGSDDGRRWESGGAGASGGGGGGGALAVLLRRCAK
jgi:hypothetical protein